jgi:hypothetical protein
MTGNLKFAVFLLLLTFLRCSLFAQKDTICFKNGDCLEGEVKSMEKGVATVETDYSDSDFKIDWGEVTQITTVTRFMITLTKGNKYFGTIASLNDSTVIIHESPEKSITLNIKDIVYLSSYKEKFLDRLSASLDIGTDLVKAQNLRKLSLRANLGYKADKWTTNASYNSIRSRQDDTDPISRYEGEINFRYLLPVHLYGIATASLLSNTEQKLDLRSNYQLGLGYYLIQTNTVYWGTKAGINRNVEKFSGESEIRSSWEGFLGTELNLFDIGDLNFLLMVMVYPGINQGGRWRSDSNLSLKYDLPLDFYIRIGGSLNYDNQSAQGASDLDYVIQAGFGWEL